MKKLAARSFCSFPRSPGPRIPPGSRPWPVAMKPAWSPSAATCPVLRTDKGDMPMAVRAAADGKFALICSAPVAGGSENGNVGDAALPVPVAASPAHPGSGRYRLPHQGRGACRPATIRHAGRFPARRRGRQSQARPGDPCRRLSLSRKRLPARQSGLRRLALGRQLDDLAGRFLYPAAALAGGRAHRSGARQSRRLQARRSRLDYGCKDPAAFDPAAPCTAHQPLYTVDLGGLTLAVLDDASIPCTPSPFRIGYLQQQR